MKIRIYFSDRTGQLRGVYRVKPDGSVEPLKSVRSAYEDTSPGAPEGAAFTEYDSIDDSAGSRARR